MAAPLTHPLNCIRGHYPMARHVTSCITVLRDRQGLRYNVTWSRQTLRYNVTWHSTRWQSGQVHWLTVGWLRRMCETATRQNARKFNGRKEGSPSAGSQCHCHTPSPCNGHQQCPQCVHTTCTMYLQCHTVPQSRAMNINNVHNVHRTFNTHLQCHTVPQSRALNINNVHNASTERAR